MRLLARLVLRHRRVVALAWLALFIAGVLLTPRTVDRLTFDFSLPGQPGYDAAQKVLARDGVAVDQTPYLLVLGNPSGPALDASTADHAFEAVQRAVPSVLVVGHGQTGSEAFASRDAHLRYAYAFQPVQRGFAPVVGDPLQHALEAAAPGVEARLTGIDALATSTSDSGGPGVLAETLIGGVGALVVLVIVFASALALLPLLMAVVSILTTFLVLLGVTYLADVNFTVQFLVSLIGLGVAIDYSLLLVTRWREERDGGGENHEAVVEAMATAGRAVAFSGLTVAIGLVSLVVLPVPFLRSVGYGGMLIPVVSVAVALTLLPALLSSIGPAIDRPRLRHEQTASRFWTAWARLVVRRRVIAAVVAAVALLALATPFLRMQIGEAQSASLAHGGPAFTALRDLEADGVPSGALTPLVVLVDGPKAGAVAGRLGAVDGVTASAAVHGTPVDARGPLVVGIPRDETSSGPTVEVVRRARAALDGTPGVFGLAGVGPLQLDYGSAVYGNMPFVIGFIVLVTFVVLARAFRSLLLPLKAIVLNLLSLAAAFGGVVLFWQDGHGSHQVFGVQPTGAITFWLPIMIFAFLFGLSMDYEVFILARIREEHDRGLDTDAAVIAGVGRTGRLVTSAAAILFLAFLSLASGPQTDIKVFGTALGFGILLDATVVRMLLVPALVSLFGRWNWVLPRPLAVVLRVREPRELTAPAAATTVGRPR